MLDRVNEFLKDIDLGQAYKEKDLISIPISSIVEKHEFWLSGFNKGKRFVAVSCSSSNLKIPKNIKLHKAVFFNCHFYDSEILCEIEDSLFLGCSFHTTQFSCEFNSSLFIDCTFQGVGFSDSSFEDVTVNNSIFTNVDLNNVWINLSEFTGNTFKKVNLTGCELSGVGILSTIGLINVNVDSCECSTIKFFGGVLEEVCIEKSEIGKSLFQNIGIKGASIHATNISNSSFISCKFNNMHITGGKISETECISSKFNKHVISSLFENAIFSCVDIQENYGFKNSKFHNSSVLVMSDKNVDIKKLGIIGKNNSVTAF